MASTVRALCGLCACICLYSGSSICKRVHEACRPSLHRGSTSLQRAELNTVLPSSGGGGFSVAAGDWVDVDYSSLQISHLLPCFITINQMTNGADWYT